MPEMKQDRIALDRAASSRTVDDDGHMRVVGSAVSKANVCGYYGAEIPDSAQLGLKPDQIYELYRDAASLRAAAQTLNGKPLLVVHKPQTAAEHDHEIVAGSLDNVRWDDPYLRADITIWDQAAIDLVTSGEQRQLSCAYRYTAVMTPGSAPDGTPFDGKMTDLSFNHCALVAEGRAGPDVMVGDAAIQIPDHTPEPTSDNTPEPEAPPEVVLASPYKSMETLVMAKNASLTRQALLASGALRAYLHPKMAADQKIDLTPILKPVTGKNWKTQKPKIKVALDAALKDKLAADADISDIIDMLDQLEDMADEDVQEAAVDADPDADEDDDTEEEKKKKAKEAAEKLKEAAAEDEDKDDEDDDDKKKPAFLKDKKAKDKKAMDKVPTVTVAAMDAAIQAAVSKATKAAEQNTIAKWRAMGEAEKICRPYIGELAVALDSAESYYRTTLEQAEVDLEGVPPAAFPAMVKMLPKPGEVAPVKVARMAADASTLADAKTRFPGLSSLKQR